MKAPKLTELEKRAVLRELVEREQRASAMGAATQPTPGELEKAGQLEAAMFAQQREFFFNKKMRRRCGKCTRRAGKTVGAAYKYAIELLRNPRYRALHLAQTSGNAREYIWPELQQIVADYDLPFEFNETNLRMSHKRSTGKILFRGADNAKAVEKYRGFKWDTVILDESGTFGAEMEELVVSVIGPSLRDNGGELLLIGTPGKFPVGLFFEVSSGLRKNWYNAFWTLNDNPHLSAEAKDLDLICEEEGLTRSDPRFIREYLGQYCVDTKTQMFVFNPAAHTYADPAEIPNDLEYILGVDFGYNDATAIVVLGYSRTSRKVWVPESWAAPKQLSDDIAAKLIEFQAKYRAKRIVGDTGGYGKGMSEQIWRDYRIYIEAQNKREKLNYVEFLNSAFRRGDVMIYRKTGLTKTLPLVLWNDNNTDAHANASDDEAMALLYAWRAAFNISGKVTNVRKRPELDALVGKIDPERLAELSEEHPDQTEWYLKQW